jgi:hypothetical protein
MQLPILCRDKFTCKIIVVVILTGLVFLICNLLDNQQTQIYSEEHDTWLTRLDEDKKMWVKCGSVVGAVIIFAIVNEVIDKTSGNMLGGEEEKAQHGDTAGRNNNQSVVNSHAEATAIGGTSEFFSRLVPS